MVEKQYGIRMVWEYDLIVAIGWNRMTNTIVDIPWYMFPWSPCLFTHLDAPDIFQCPVQPFLGPISHRLVAACCKCSKQKVKCVQQDGLQCDHCGYMECVPGQKEDLGRIGACYKLADSVFFALSPPYQHLIMCAKVAASFNGGPTMSCDRRAQLGALVQASFVGGDESIERIMIEGMDAYQKVVFQNGTMKVVDSRCVNRLGFNAPPYSTARQAAMACTPHLGVADYRVALTLLDNALEKAGVVCWKDECVWTGSEFVSARIFSVARIMDANTIFIAIGFKFQK